MVQKKTLKYRLIFFNYILFIVSSCIPFSVIPESSHNNKIIENVPFFPQDAYKCGPASLASVLNYYGVNESPDDITRQIFSKGAKGTLTIDMFLYAENKGMYVKQYIGNIDDIRKNIDSNNPLIVLVDYGIYFYKKNHFMVIVGYNEKGIVVNSGKRKGQFIFYDDFLKIWEKTNFWTLLIKK